MKYPVILKATAALAVVLTLSACSVGEDYQRPAVNAPAAFSQGRGVPADQIAQDWWKSFGSTELNGLIDKAVADNTDISAAIARIEQARAQLKIAGADLLPSVDANVDAGRSRNNPASGRTTTSTNLGAGLSVNYEVDLFGRNRATRDSARASLDAARFDKEAVNLLVMGEVARTYFTLVNGYERLKIADDTLRNARELLNIVEARLDAGAASSVDVAQQRAALATTEAQRATIVRGIATAENALAVLVGEPAQTVKVRGRSLAMLNIPAISPGQPSRLLERRPDIRTAEQNLVAANANITAARAALFPSLNLGLGASIASGGFGDPTSTVINALAGLTAPIFQGGRLEGGVEQATARQKELLAAYRKAILVSFQEVEDALAGITATQNREKLLATASREASRAYQLSRELYDAGATDFQTLLDVQRDELSAKDSYSQSRSERLTTAVDLYLALGGGWSDRVAR